jgi:hypothetical protein
MISLFPSLPSNLKNQVFRRAHENILDYGKTLRFREKLYNKIPKENLKHLFVLSEGVL